MTFKVQDRHGGQTPRLFCPRCDVLMSTDEDVRSRDSRGVCASCVADGKTGIVRDPALDAVRMAVRA